MKKFFLFIILIFFIGCNKSDIVAYYKMDECIVDKNHKIVKDSSEYKNDATAKHGPNNTDGKYATPCLDFGAIICNNLRFRGDEYYDSLNNRLYKAQYYLEVNDSDTLSPLVENSEMSATGWFRTSKNGTQTIISKLYEYKVYLENGDLKLTLWDKNKSPYSFTIQKNVNDNNWHFFAFAVSISTSWWGRNSRLKGKVYYGDGIRNRLRSKNIKINNFNPRNTDNNLFIGATKWKVVKNYFDGFLDEIGIYKIEMSSSDIKTIYKNQKNHKDTDENGNAVDRKCECFCSDFSEKIQAEYRMDECSWNHTEGDVKDNSGNGFNGTSKIADTESNKTQNGMLCKVGDFTHISQNDNNDNEDDLVILPNDVFDGLENFTFTAWIKTNQTGNHKRFTLLSVANKKTDNEVWIYFTNGNKFYPYLKGKKVGTIKLNKYINDNKWHFVTVTRKNLSNKSKICIIIDGDIDNKKCKNVRKTGGKIVAKGIVLGQDQDKILGRYENYQEFNGYMDEVKIFKDILHDEEIKNIYNNEKNRKNYDGSKRKCPNCNQTQINYAFNAVSKIIYNDAVKDWDNNLTTQIVNKAFDIYILSKNKDTNTSEEANITKVIFMYFSDGESNSCSGENEENQTVCNDLSSNTCPDINDSSGEVKIENIKVTKAVKCIKVYIQGKQLNNIQNILQEANSTDNFATRPYKFDITDIDSKIKAGSEFNISIRALDYDNNPSLDYNESVHTENTTVKLEYNITKDGCDNGELNITDGAQFKNGETNITLFYNEVGDLNLTLKEINGSEFAKVDADDTPDNERFIKPVTKTLSIEPHHFMADINISDFDKNFTYLDNNLNIYSLIDLNITAKNEQNKTTENYNTKCFAKDVDVNLTPDIFRHNDKLSKDSIYKVIYVNSDSLVYKNRDINFSVKEGNFTTDHNGSALIRIYVNFERNISKPEDPFEYNISNAEIKIHNGDTNLTYFNCKGKSLFYYGVLNMNDIITYKNDFNISHEFLIYDTNESDTYIPKSKEIILDYYLNLYNKTKDANISNFVVTKGYVYKDSDKLNTIDVNPLDINETLNLNIKRNGNDKFVVIHIIDSNASHLWYSKFEKEYNISKNSSCANHFCFTVTWKSEKGEKGVITGDTNGTKADVNSSEINEKGVKLFR